MPGKINPVMAETLCQIAAQVIGNDAAITTAGLSGNFELNVMMPVMAFNLLQSIQLLSSGARLFNRKLIEGLKADKQRCAEMVEKSLAMVTSLSGVIGYDEAARIAHQAYAENKTIRQVLLEKQLLPAKEIDRLLDPWSMV